MCVVTYPHIIAMLSPIPSLSPGYPHAYDTGEGISPDFLPRIFNRFEQADTSITRRHSDLDLGLAIVKHLVELHGGGIQAKSDGVGKGATFIVSLPPKNGPRRLSPA
jgi:signal transduction histidine kinase